MDRFRPGKLRQARLACHLSQADLAVLAGLDDSVVAMLEAGAHRPSPPVVAKLAQALNLTIADLAPLPRWPTLADYRQQTGRTAGQLAAELRMPRPTLSRIETGRLQPRDAARHANYLGIDVAELRSTWVRTNSRRKAAARRRVTAVAGDLTGDR